MPSDANGMPEGEVPFEAALADLPEPPIYQKIFEKALHLNQLGMNPNRIAFHLGVDRLFRIFKALPPHIGPR